MPMINVQSLKHDGHGSREPLIQIKDVKKYYHQPARLLEKWLVHKQDKYVYAVDNVNFDIYEGETLGLVGESGCGKSTLGRTIIRLHQATEGQILYRQDDVTRMDRKELQDYRRKAQMIFQNPYSSLNPRKTVRDIIAVALKRRGVLARNQQEKELALLMERVGLAKRHLDQYPHQFSGGQRQRIGVARALAMQPEFLVADEPVSALDVSVQAQIINLLEELQKELSLTYLFISHDLSVVNHVSSRIAVMYLGQLVELAATDKLFSNPKHPYTQALLSSVPSLERKGVRERIILEGTVSTPLEQPVGCRFKNRCFAKIGDICDTVRPVWRGENGHGVACHLYSS